MLVCCGGGEREIDRETELCERGRTQCATGGSVCERWGTSTGVRVAVVYATEFCCELDTLTVAHGKATLHPNSLWLAVST